MCSYLFYKCGRVCYDDINVIVVSDKNGSFLVVFLVFCLGNNDKKWNNDNDKNNDSVVKYCIYCWVECLNSSYFIWW